MTTPTIRAALERLTNEAEYLAKGGEDLDRVWARINAARAALNSEPEGPANPSGYAYRYRDYSGGTYIKFNGGEEVNGSRPIEAVPYWFMPPSVPTAPPTLETPAEALAALRRVPVAGISDEHRKAVCTAIAEALGEAYDCQRVWSAWSYGTMGPDDFTLTAEDDDRVAEIADAAIEVIGNFAMQTEVAVGEQLRIVKAGIRAGYDLGHHHTVEGGWGDPDEVADDIAQDTLDSLDPLPAPQVGEGRP